MDYEFQRQVTGILQRALRESGDGDGQQGLVSLLGLRRKLDAAGISYNDIGLFDSKVGGQSLTAANAVLEKRDYANGIIHADACVDKLFRDIEDELAGQPRDHTGGNIVTLSQGAKTVGHTKQAMIGWIKDAGPDGLTRQAIMDRDPNNRGFQRRFKEAIDGGKVFPVEDKLVHTSYRDSHPEAYAAYEAARLEEIDS